MITIKSLPTTNVTIDATAIAAIQAGHEMQVRQVDGHGGCFIISPKQEGIVIHCPQFQGRTHHLLSD